MFSFRKPMTIPTRDDALPGRLEALPTAETHYVNSIPLKPPFPHGIETAVFGLGCFWGAERKFWELPGVYATAVGYAGGLTPNPTYEEVCSGHTGHNEVVFVAYDPAVIAYTALLKVFFESHNPTLGMRQGNDVGTQYRSGLYGSPAQQAEARAVRAAYEPALRAMGFGPITTEIMDTPPFYYAEAYHQQYLAKNPAGYCGLGGTGVRCPVGTDATAAV
ncbi:peptide-methionine (S)-S-oxide reductase MsrA [Beijerinckia sp. L45]|uniref:peptide-methionine (S)-S-oxide reductase MsrA n=1 Tax=Beijerinckia sp. L45 TaxID=1641855 RepID=UPI00131B1F2A|nr:peptide-methionine (S)-S-oxide reductase MsrA [Beijerinckia sp. L45]